MIKVMMRGCNGQMGQVITSMVAEEDGMEIVAGIDVSQHIQNSYPVYSNIVECKDKVDVIIDFASPNAMDELLLYAKENQIPIVLCTTGLSEEQIHHVEEISKEIAILRSANMSLGVNLLLKLLKDATAVLATSGFDIEIIERHHNKKADAPSGTALAFADTMNEVLEGAYEYCYDRSDRREPRKKKEIGISAVRGGNIVGDHEILFAGTDEIIEFRHTATSKKIFARGAVSAARFLAGQGAGLYDMSDVIG